MKPLPKNPIMALAETLVTVNGAMLNRTEQKEHRPNLFAVDLDELQDLQTITESAFDNTYFFQALNQIEEIERNVRTFLKENIQQSIIDAKNRICEDCGGSGMVEPSNPNSKDCHNCHGVGVK